MHINYLLRLSVEYLNWWTNSMLELKRNWYIKCTQYIASKHEQLCNFMQVLFNFWQDQYIMFGNGSITNWRHCSYYGLTVTLSTTPYILACVKDYAGVRAVKTYENEFTWMFNNCFLWNWFFIIKVDGPKCSQRM